MATDEVLAAAERRLIANKGPEPWKEIYGDDGEFDEDWDARDLADAYIAHLDAQRQREEERAKPVTRETLIDLGFLPDDSGDDSLYRKIWQPHEPEDNRDWDGDMCHLFVECDMSFGFESYTKDGDSLAMVAAGQFKTKGQLLDLLRGLGIEPAKRGVV